MTDTRYKQERTLTRRLKRPAGVSPEDFKKDVSRLREHFERFNVDVSELCQWLMGLRPGGKRGSGETEGFWRFFLEDEPGRDRARRIAFDYIAKTGPNISLDGLDVNKPVLDAISKTADRPRTPTAKGLFKRMSGLSPAHRQVLLKAAAEWVVARYWRGMENWERRHEEWKKEREEWEKQHPEQTEDIRAEFGRLFNELGIRDKRPRLCSWETLKESRNNCEFAGETIGKKRHAALCKKYRDFSKEYEKGKYKKPFEGCVEDYLDIRRDRKYGSSSKALDEFVNRDRKKRAWFKTAWPKYLNALGISEATALKGPLHCFKFTDDGCEYNKHHADCEDYHRLLSKRPELQPLEKTYREWRRDYLSGPSKPSFKYPSTKDLPMPKIFGKGFFDIDFKNSILKLRLDDMPEGQYLTVGFAPWPGDYSPRPGETEITSVHINFAGRRARAGFRFVVPHKESYFGITQEELDMLRSRKYPRQRQDKQFLDEARRLLLGSYSDKKPLRYMTVDLGTGGGCASVFEGETLLSTTPLKIIKIDRLYEAAPKTRKDRTGKGEDAFPKERGLRVEHAGMHLETWASEASSISQKRNRNGVSGLGSHDLRGLTLHMRGMYKDWVRLNAAQIIKVAEEYGVHLIVFESLRGFSIPGRDRLEKDEKRRKAFWSQGRIRHKVKEKAVERGMRVIDAPYFKSSQICAECGHAQENQGLWLKNKKGGKFKCEKCPNESGSDENATRVLGKVFLGVLQLPDAERV